MQYELDINGFNPYEQSKGFSFHPEQAKKPVIFTENYLSHVKGFKGKFLLSDWQKTFLANLFGWFKVEEPTERRFQFATLEIARKNGKSTLVSSIVLFAAFCSDEQGQEIYLAANSVQQAGIIFDILAGMIRQSDALSAKCKILDARKRIIIPKTMSFIQVLSSDGDIQDGLNASVCIYDELSMAPNRKLFDILKTSQGSRKNPLFVCLSTPGWERDSVFFEIHTEGENVRKNQWDNPRFLPAIYSTDADKDDWRIKSTWEKANPNLGISIREEFIKQECDRAIRFPSYQAAFRRLHCCQWIENNETFLCMGSYRKCITQFPDLSNANCWLGLDLSISKDLSALGAVIKDGDKTYLQAWGFLPEENIRDRETQDKKPYRQWAKEGYLILTPGKVVNYDFIYDKIRELSRTYNVQQIAYDQYNAAQLTNKLEEENFEMVRWGQYYRFMNGPLREIERKIITQQLCIEANPLFESCCQNASIETNSEGHIRLIKPQDNRRIDLLVAVAMAYGLTLAKDNVFDASILWS